MSGVMLLTGGRVFPAVKESVIDDGAVLVEADRIAWLGAAEAVGCESEALTANALRQFELETS